MGQQLLFYLAVLLLTIGIAIKIYGMACLANKKWPEAERLARYKKTIPVSYALLLPTIAIIIYLIVTK